MVQRKTQENNTSVKSFLHTVDNETRRKDSFVVTKLMEKVSGKKAKMWGTSIVGCGKHFYAYANGSEAEICKIGFAPRKNSMVFYLAKFNGKTSLLQQLGKHSIRGGCLYINKLEDIDLDVLEELIEKAYLHNA